MNLYEISKLKSAQMIVFFTVTLAVVTVPLEAQESKISDTEATSLFNGKDLTGWKKVGGDGSFKVEGGCIVGFGVKVRGNTFLRTEKTYTDFEFTYDFKFDHLTGNSGVMFRAEQKPSDDGNSNGRVFGYQCEADNKKERGWTAGIYDEKRRGWLAPRKITKKEGLTADEVTAQLFGEEFTKQASRIFKWDDWNTITIRCEGNNIKTYLNGELRVDFTDTDEEHDTREGFFGLQVHAGKACQARWRNLMLTDLSH